MTAVPLGESLPAFSILPFVAMLLSIAVFPLVLPRFWHQHYPKVALFWALVFAIPFCVKFRGGAAFELTHTLLGDYLPFLVILFGLYTVAGGIAIRGSWRATPAANTALMAVGTIAASFIGTTGASMLLIRPLLKTNEGRRHRVHTVVVFIFLVSNIGGSLTPLGDPPLFLGFLQGVPFLWTFHLAPHLAFGSSVLLAVYFGIDSIYVRRERSSWKTLPAPSRPPAPPDSASARKQPVVRIDGRLNFVFLGGILFAVLLSGTWQAGSITVYGIEFAIADLARDILIVAMGALSLRLTPRAVRAANGFSWAPMKEVACLFAGIFVTMIPALAILAAAESGALAGVVRSVQSPLQFFWVAGGLTSFLDNAPTYMTFLTTALGKFHPGMEAGDAIARLIAENGRVLEAISVGAVFMGANTYIGNAPNFMVKSIAEEAGVPMPSFFGYILRWSLPILFPLFMVIGIVFFR